MNKAITQERLEREAKINRIEVHKGKIISLFTDHISYQKGKEKTFDLVSHPGAVVMIPIDADGNLILIKQWRRASNQILIEFPAGTLEENEDPEVCAQRELQEEIGMRAKEIIPFGGFFTAPGFCTEYLHLFIARGLIPDPLMGDDTDEIDSLTVSVEDACQMIEQGKIIDAKTVAGIYRYKNWVT